MNNAEQVREENHYTTPDHAEVLYQNHKIDVEAARELGGIAAVGNAEPGSDLSQRSKWLLAKNGNDKLIAAADAKAMIEENAGKYNAEVTANLDQYIAHAKEDMKVDEIYKRGSRLMGRQDIYDDRRRKGIQLGAESGRVVPLRPGYREATRAIDPVTGRVDNYRPLDHPPR